MKPEAKPRVAIYARYSSKVQNPLSIDDQVALCRKLIAREFGVDPGGAAVFSDRELTGATDRREGLKAMLEAAERNEFDVAVAEGLDRFSRELGDSDNIFERLAYNGVSMHTAHEGRLSKLHIGFKGTMNAIFLDDLKDKIRRGQRARAEEGLNPGNCAYGYRVVRGVVDERNRNVNGLSEIVPEKAEVVRRIFKEFAAGKSPTEIARGLNDDRIPAPRGRIWKPASIRGRASRNNGILRNELYHGVLVYNRLRKMIDPVTRKQVHKLNPESEWIRTPVPHLRIVDDALWGKARKRLMRPPAPRPAVRKRRSSKQPASWVRPHNIQTLTGLVRCGVCGGLAHLANLGRYVCADARYVKTCNNTRGKRVPEMARVLFPALRESLEEQRDLFAGVNALVERERERHAALEKEIAEADAGIERFMEVIEKGLLTERAFERMAELEKRLTEAKNAIRAVPTLPAPERDVRLTLGRALGRMKLDLLEQAPVQYLRHALRLVVESITLTPILDRPTGSTIHVCLKPRGWPELWRVMTAVYPDIAAPPARKVGKR